ncbi:class I lanthipeptide [Taibaiella koreensis]|uniref:class I lanthipeptide n=1 Tax=Taibaiella koreensis TaxID=1268548 RepID=UPI000E59E926|nr:class I lanthipeptide [Taibaiella koreensis]
MKKQHLSQRKLSLNKKMIAPLHPGQQLRAAGGATDSACQLTKDKTLCQGNTDQYGCTTHSLGIACTVIFCV